MPSPLCALYLKQLLHVSGQRASCLGVVLPIQTDVLTPVKLDQSFESWVNGECEKAAYWSHVTELEDPPMSLNSEFMVRSYSQSLGRFSVESESIKHIQAPCYLLPSPDLKLCFVDVELIVNTSTHFETPGFQSYLWLNAVSGIQYGGFFGGLDHVLVDTARKLPLREGDFFPFMLKNTKLGGGIATLGRKKDGGVFQASVSFATDKTDLSLPPALMLRSICEFEGTIAAFEREFAAIRS